MNYGGIKKCIQKKLFLNQSGITLIALVVTIVVLLILAGVTINLLFSDTGLFGKAQEAKNTWENAENSDREAIGELSNQVNEILNGIGTESGGGTNPDDEPVSLPTDGSYSELKGVNTPDLAEELQLEENKKLVPIVWDETANSGAGGWKKTESNSAWYDYTTTEKRWANAVIGGQFDEKGILNEEATGYAMFVWIPRYAYQISSNYHNGGSGVSGTINIKFMNGTGNTAADGSSSWNNVSGEGNWNIHPAFNYNGTKAGIWVAKFEASRDNATSSSAGSGSTLKIQPGVQSWRSISVNDIFNTCKNYNSSLNSHMMKNSEWGAVAYLSKSSYGINGEIWNNPNSNYITGHAGTGPSVGATTSTYDYSNKTYGVNASTTGTIYGIYDMSGGAYEYVAAYVNNGHDNLQDYGSSLVSAASYMKDVYTSSEDTQSGNYNETASKYGDALYETSSTGINGTKSWYEDDSNFPTASHMFFIRGGYYNINSRAGAFAFGHTERYWRARRQLRFPPCARLTLIVTCALTKTIFKVFFEETLKICPYNVV